MRLKLLVGAAIAVFFVFLLFFLVEGYMLDKPHAVSGTAMQQHKKMIKDSGLLDPQSPPIMK